MFKFYTRSDFEAEQSAMKETIPPRNFQRVVYPPVGKCIYCGDNRGPLNDEHIIPFSLGGLLILEKASCLACARVTGSFEGAVARSLFGNFRVRHNLPTRRRHQRPSHFGVSRLGDNVGKLAVPASEFPAPAFMYKCTTAGILAGLRSDIDTSGQWQIVAIVSREEMDSFQRKYGKDTTFAFRNVAEQFARTVAKIGHSYAVAFFGTEAYRPLAVDLILGRTRNLSYIVGGSFEIKPSVPDAGHLLEISARVDGTRALVIVHLRLFASAGTPDYHIVVGQTEEESATKKLIQNSEMVRLP